jgi:hypothetical protein
VVYGSGNSAQTYHRYNSDVSGNSDSNGIEHANMSCFEPSDVHPTSVKLQVVANINH